MKGNSFDYINLAKMAEMLIERYFRLCYYQFLNACRSMRAHGMEANQAIKNRLPIRLIK
ncbi:hypothetical protein [Paraburkholderia unamae]|uniref:Uncharacterized protein n=1 Tax=Paraburkholderia unamae TaxID=219649 RepID=A0ABX5KY26_9BURK|nr:hypothetical protein [Paraburkholderia unamae]PVX98032.1 hypothetical protein C7402_101750 [Paraburkholderia unamae]RAR61720.1 hypothetical protein C7401_10741 [Paraburkholderia unamae]CAG9249259.1 hypothetical protein PUN4_140050 [Paraburkholderia unamae]